MTLPANLKCNFLFCICPFLLTIFLFQILLPKRKRLNNSKLRNNFFAKISKNLLSFANEKVSVWFNLTSTCHPRERSKKREIARESGKAHATKRG